LKNNKYKIAFHTLGCKVNFAESSYIAQKFKDAGYQIVSFNDKSDAYVINTCSVTHSAVKKSRNTINSILKKHPAAKIVITGCITETEKEIINKIEGVGLIIGANEKNLLFDQLDALLKGDHQNDVILSNTADSFFESYSTDERTRAFVKVQDGCNYFCSYCVIPYARGRSRSSYIDDIAGNVEKIIKDGVKEIVITGINIGDFSNNKGETLYDLLATLSSLEGLKRLRLSSIEPDLLTDEIISLAANSATIMPHFHLPLQSGSDKILKAMNRKYDTAFFKRKINNIFERIPDCCIGTDLIVGFPGESETDFNDTLNFINDLPLSYIHVFPYSKRSLTKAAGLIDDNSPYLKKMKVKTLSDLSEKKKATFYASQLNKTHKILFESANNNGYINGFTENYIKVKAAYNKMLINTIIEIKITDIDTDGLFVYNVKND